MSELGKMIGCVALWGFLILSAWLTAQITERLSDRGDQEMRCFEERIIDLAVDQSITRSKQLTASNLRG